MATACDGNGGPKTRLELERRDWLKVAGFVFALVGGILGPSVALAMYVFQTRANALVEHAKMEKVSALQAQETTLRREFNEAKVKTVEKDVEDTKLTVITIHANQKAFMRDMGARRAKPLPASVDVDFGELGQ